MTLPIGIVDLLERYGFDPSVPTKMVRHQDPSRIDIHELRRRGWLELYQGFQGKPVFGKAKQLIVFLGDGKTRAKFYAVYRVAGRRAPKSVEIPPDFPFPEWAETDSFYDLEPLEGFEDLQDRVIIEWGKGTRSWVQNLRNKEVVEILPRGRVRDAFVDYLEFTLSFEELRQIVQHPEANRDWQARLASVAGIYLIVASTTGKQYVGSAHGKEGIWGRWESYATNGHGGNKLLRELVKSDSNYPTAFRYTLLQVLPSTTTKAEVLDWERKYKEKLGTRATGLNLN